MTARAALLVGVLATAPDIAAPLVGQTPPQAPPRADAAISGIVSDAGTKEPIPDAVVELGSVALSDFRAISHRQFTDSRGRFAFTDLPAGGDYVITVFKSGYFDGAYGRLGPAEGPTRRISVRDGSWLKTANISLWRPGSLAGRVVDERGEPVIGVYVRALAAFRVAGQDRYAVGHLTMTDDRGIYRIGNLLPGRYVTMVPSVQSSAPASATAATLQGLSAQAVANAQASGRGLPAGDPMIDAGTDTRVGVGGYPVPPPPTNGRALTYPAAFSGGTTLTQATAVLVESGIDRVGVDIRLDPVPAVRISGIVQGPADAVGGFSLRLLSPGMEDLGTGSEAGTALTGPDGTFAFANVPAGTYTIEASVSMNSYTAPGSSLAMFYGPQLPRPPGGTSTSSIGGPTAIDGIAFTAVSMSNRKHWARVPVTAGATGASNIVLTIKPAGTISGRLIGEADSNFPKPENDPRFVNLETATGAVWPGRPRSVNNRTAPPGEFTIEGVLPGLYLLRGESSPWMIKSVVLGGRDYTYAPIDTTTNQTYSGVVVTFTNAVPSLTGTARDQVGTGVADATVVVFPVEPDQWTNYGIVPVRIKSVRTSTAGEFRFRSLPAGDYFVVALSDTQATAWQDAGFFQRAQASSTRVTVAWGEKKTLDVRLSQVK
jgi:carboxypeptidase family protein